MWRRRGVLRGGMVDDGRCSWGDKDLLWRMDGFLVGNFLLCGRNHFLSGHETQRKMSGEREET
jgi:hypothetical protein